MWSIKPNKDEVENWAYLHSALSPEECKKVIELGESYLVQQATTFGGSNLEVRDSKVSWISPSEESKWLFEKITEHVLRLNAAFFNFDLDGFQEGFQFTKYEAPAGKYVLHIDKTYQQLIRKLSVVIQLSDPSNYEGGELLIQAGSEPFPMKKEQGYMVTFPSYVVHGVTPVTKGTRYSLVAWITGPQFK